MILPTHQYPSYERVLTHRALLFRTFCPSHPGELSVEGRTRGSGVRHMGHLCCSHTRTSFQHISYSNKGPLKPAVCKGRQLHANTCVNASSAAFTVLLTDSSVQFLVAYYFCMISATKNIQILKCSTL